MNLFELQADLRHFAAERDWQPFHTPKNLSTALMVEAAELAEIFQWMTPEQSRGAHLDPASKQRTGEEVADVLFYLLQMADHCEIDIARAVEDKLVRNALKHPATRAVPRVWPVGTAIPGTHILLDYENVQPTEDELRAMVPDARQVWVFHGPHQREIEQRFTSFGADVTAVPISKSGKNALDFHLSFYLGYIASRNRASSIVVVANDKGYEPLLEHAKALGFAVRQQGHAAAKPGASVMASPAAKAGAPDATQASKADAKQQPARSAPAKKVLAKPPAIRRLPAKRAVAKAPTAAVPVAKKAPAKAATSAGKLAAKSAIAPTARKSTVAGPGSRASGPTPLPAKPSLVSAEVLKKMTDSLRKMGDKRPVKPASLRRALKSFLGAETADDSIEVAFGKLIATNVVAVNVAGCVLYPRFDRENGPL
jgi:NTP pyrophosphatase (non-canonical NTP hydrolase)